MSFDEADQEFSASIAELSNIGSTVDGTGFAFRTVTCVGKRIIALKNIAVFTNLLHIDLSDNLIRDIAPLKGLPLVLDLNLASNEIRNIQAIEDGSLPHLLKLDLRKNGLTSLPPIPFPSLTTACFAQNEIAACHEFVGHKSLEKLDLSKNQITSSTGVANMPKLTELDLSTNKMTELEGLVGMPELRSLNLASNCLESLVAPWAEYPLLTSLDFSTNQVADVKLFQAIRALPRLRVLEAEFNPFPAGDGVPDSRIELLICHWRLDRINGTSIADSDRDAARDLNVERLSAEQRRLQEEAEAEAAAAAAAAMGDE